MSKDYSKAIEDAEKQVAGVKNEKLREIAFSKLLSHLLDGNSSDGDDDVDEKEAPKKTNAKAKRRATPKGTKTKTDGPKVWLEELVTEKFFSNPKSSADIREELETRSHHLSATDLTFPLQALCHGKKLRRKKVAPENGGKSILHWVNW